MRNKKIIFSVTHSYKTFPNSISSFETCVNPDQLALYLHYFGPYDEARLIIKLNSKIDRKSDVHIVV